VNWTKVHVFTCALFVTNISLHIASAIMRAITCNRVSTLLLGKHNACLPKHPCRYRGGVAGALKPVSVKRSSKFPPAPRTGK
jgi:hypothetical protein